MAKVKKMAFGGLGSMAGGSSAQPAPAQMPPQASTGSGFGKFASRIAQAQPAAPTTQMTDRPAPFGGKTGTQMLAALRASRGMKKGGSVKSSASKRADGCAKRGKTRGKMV